MNFNCQTFSYFSPFIFISQLAWITVKRLSFRSGDVNSIKIYFEIWILRRVFLFYRFLDSFACLFYQIISADFINLIFFFNFQDTKAIEIPWNHFLLPETAKLLSAEIFSYHKSIDDYIFSTKTQFTDSFFFCLMCTR